MKNISIVEISKNSNIPPPIDYWKNDHASDNWLFKDICESNIAYIQINDKIYDEHPSTSVTFENTVEDDGWIPGRFSFCL
jgi:hypothetical protein